MIEAHSTDAPGRAWPELMRAATAAQYLDEPSLRTFRKRVGKDYPKPIRVEGRGDLWRKRDLDGFIAGLRNAGRPALDAADVL